MRCECEREEIITGFCAYILIFLFTKEQTDRKSSIIFAYTGTEGCWPLHCSKRYNLPSWEVVLKHLIRPSHNLKIKKEFANTVIPPIRLQLFCPNTQISILYIYAIFADGSRFNGNGFFRIPQNISRTENGHFAPAHINLIRPNELYAELFRARNAIQIINASFARRKRIGEIFAENRGKIQGGFPRVCAVPLPVRIRSVCKFVVFRFFFMCNICEIGFIFRTMILLIELLGLKNLILRFFCKMLRNLIVCFTF